MSVVCDAAREGGGRTVRASEAFEDLPALIINLDGERERWAHISAEAVRAGLAAERIPAVSGFDVPEHLRHKFFSGSASEPSSLLLPGEVGCYASHLLAYERIVESGLDWALVLEDDVRLSSDFVRTVRDTVFRLPEGWDIVRLSSRPSRAVMSLCKLRSGRHIVRYSKLPKQAGAQLVSAAGARKLLAGGLRVRPIDADLRYGYLFGLDTFGVFPPPAHHEGLFRSSIKIAKGSRRDVRGGRWKAPRLYQRVFAGRDMLHTLGVRGTLACLATDSLAWAARLMTSHRPRPTQQPKTTVDATV